MDLGARVFAISKHRVLNVLNTGPRNRSFCEKTVKNPKLDIKIPQNSHKFESFMENNGREQWDPTLLPQWENLYVYVGIFHGFIAKKPIPGRSENIECTRNHLPSPVSQFGKLRECPLCAAHPLCPSSSILHLCAPLNTSLRLTLYKIVHL